MTVQAQKFVPRNYDVFAGRGNLMTLSFRGLTLELTGREASNQAYNLADEVQAESAVVE